jgi:hypothetical protein
VNRGELLEILVLLALFAAVLVLGVLFDIAEPAHDCLRSSR